MREFRCGDIELKGLSDALLKTGGTVNKVEAIAKLRERAKVIKALGATSLYLFGSVVRNEAKRASDLDVFIDYDRDSRFNALHLVGIKQYLENELGLMWTSQRVTDCIRCYAPRSSNRRFASFDDP